MSQALAVILLRCLAGLPPAGTAAPDFDDVPRLMLQPAVQQESIYLPFDLADASRGTNEGALSLGIDVRYMTDYVFRGLELVEPQTSEDAVNIQVEADLRMDLGRLPDPFLRIFTNTAEGDDFSNFQVIRPAVGLAWETDLFEIDAGTQSFTYPDRDDLDSGEIFAELRINDGWFFTEDEPILGPFFFVAYDYDRFEGTYAEAGLRRSFEVGDTNFRVSVEGLVAYVNNFELYAEDPDAEEGTGFSHYQVGVTATYRLNSLLNISRRYGQWGVAGYLYYTDGIDNDLGATSQIWGGGGITFRY